MDAPVSAPSRSPSSVSSVQECPNAGEVQAGGSAATTSDSPHSSFEEEDAVSAPASPGDTSLGNPRLELVSPRARTREERACVRTYLFVDAHAPHARAHRLSPQLLAAEMGLVRLASRSVAWRGDAECWRERD